MSFLPTWTEANIVFIILKKHCETKTIKNVSVWFPSTCVSPPKKISQYDIILFVLIVKAIYYLIKVFYYVTFDT